ncbi:hypothetical protein Tco_0109459 [Tanacetum coccineum]
MIVQIKNRLLTAISCQKSYADVRRRPMEFQVGDMVLLKVSPWKGVIRFGKRDLSLFEGTQSLVVLKLKVSDRQFVEHMRFNDPYETNIVMMDEIVLRVIVGRLRRRYHSRGSYVTGSSRAGRAVTTDVHQCGSNDICTAHVGKYDESGGVREGRPRQETDEMKRWMVELNTCSTLTRRQGGIYGGSMVGKWGCEVGAQGRVWGIGNGDDWIKWMLDWTVDGWRRGRVGNDAFDSLDWSLLLSVESFHKYCGHREVRGGGRGGGVRSSAHSSFKNGWLGIIDVWWEGGVTESWGSACSSGSE